MIITPSFQDVRINLQTLAIAVGGGLLFAVLGVPAAFLSGAVLACTVAALCKVQQDVSDPLKNASFIVIGIVVGTTIDQETLRLLPSWPISLAALAFAMIALLVIVPRFFMRAHGFDPATARLCAIPGAMSLVLALSENPAVDAKRVAILQSLRLFILMLMVPALAGIGIDTGVAHESSKPILDMLDIAIVTALSVLGVPLMKWMRMPAAPFTGPMIISAILFGSGLFKGRLPDPAVDVAFIVLGAMIGSRFSDVDRYYLFDCLKAGLGGILLAIAITGLVAWPTAAYLGLSFIQLWLAMAPGGFDTMTALAIALDLDPAFVAGHQFVRLIGLYLFVPFLFRDAGVKETERPQSKRG